jgi:4-amino-4-deoxy-L-arabinose transferase-like glycosyltransferase
VLWSAWLLLYGTAFSAADLIQGYYLATLIPAIAALAGTGVWVLWRAARAGSCRAGLALGALVVGQAAWDAWLLHGTYALISGLIVAAAALAVVVATGSAALRARRHSTRPGGARGTAVAWRVTAVAAVVGASAMVVGPLAAIAWLEDRAGGPFDAALSGEGTLARPTPAVQAARLQVEGVHGGSIRAQYTSGEWARFTGDGAIEQARQEAQNNEFLVFTSAEASAYIAYGTSSVVPVGGFSGNVPYPSVGQVEQLIDAGRISFAVLPAADALTANDPRVRAVELLCSPFEGTISSTDDVIYECG